MITALQTVFFLVLAMGIGAACAFLNGGLRQLPAQMFHGGVALVAFSILAPLMLTGEPAPVLMAVSGLAGIMAFAGAGHLIALARRFGANAAPWCVTPFSFSCAVLAGAACGIASIPALACGLLVSALIFMARTDNAVHPGLTPDILGVGIFCTAAQRAAIYPELQALNTAKPSLVTTSGAPASVPQEPVVRRPALLISATPVTAQLAANDNDSVYSTRLA